MSVCVNGQVCECGKYCEVLGVVIRLERCYINASPFTMNPIYFLSPPQCNIYSDYTD